MRGEFAMEMDSLVMLYVPCGSEEEAASIATQLVAAGLVACGNIIESRSIYKWEGKPVDQTEYLLIAKTVRSRSKAARTRIEQMHSYDVPCIITLFPEAINAEYESWVRGEVLSGHAGVAIGRREEY
jgi:periplasmic divalent cation tolerance protein